MFSSFSSAPGAQCVGQNPQMGIHDSGQTTSGAAGVAMLAAILREGGDHSQLVQAVKSLSNAQIAAAVYKAPDALRQPAKPDGNWWVRCLCPIDRGLNVGQRLLVVLAFNRTGCRTMGKVRRADAMLAQQIIDLGIDCRPVLHQLGGGQSRIVPQLFGWSKLYRALAHNNMRAAQEAIE